MSEKGHCQMEIVIPELWKRNKPKTGEDKGKAQPSIHYFVSHWLSAAWPQSARCSTRPCKDKDLLVLSCSTNHSSGLFCIQQLCYKRLRTFSMSMLLINTSVNSGVFLPFSTGAIRISRNDGIITWSSKFAWSRKKRLSTEVNWFTARRKTLEETNNIKEKVDLEKIFC